MNFSQLDTSIPLDEDQWAVTLIKAKRGNHAMIVAEGEKDGRVYWVLAHLKGPSSFKDRRNGSSCYFGKRGQVEVKEFPGSKKIQFGAKTETWQRSRAKIEEMLEEAKAEEELLESEVVDNPSPFSIFGRKSVFTRSVKQIEVTSPELQQLRREDPRLFKSVHEESLDSTYMIKKLAISCLIVPIPVLNIVPCLIYLQVNHRIFTCDDGTRDRLVELAKEHVTEKEVKPDSCFTWAREKLHGLDIDIDEKGFDAIIAVTSRYTKKSERKSRA